jgi:hypothetical protein
VNLLALNFGLGGVGGPATPSCSVVQTVLFTALSMIFTVLEQVFDHGLN